MFFLSLKKCDFTLFGAEGANIFHTFFHTFRRRFCVFTLFFILFGAEGADFAVDFRCFLYFLGDFSYFRGNFSHFFSYFSAAEGGRNFFTLFSKTLKKNTGHNGDCIQTTTQPGDTV